MASPIGKKELNHLAELARIKLAATEEERLLTDLQKIVEHFKELKELDTANVPPMTGGTARRNIFRDDTAQSETNAKKGAAAFPETEKGFLKVPAVFDHND